MTDVAELADRYWDLQCAAEPLVASVLGDHRYDDRLPDLSAEGQAELAAALRALAADAAATAPDPLSATDRYTRALIIDGATTGADVVDAAMVEFTVAPLFIGPQAQLLQLSPVITLPLAEHAEALLTRYANVPTFMAQAAQRLRDGVARERTPPAIAVTQVIAQLTDHLATPLADDPMLTTQPPPDWDGTDAWRDRLAAVVRDTVRPALAEYRDVLRTEILPVGRDAEHSGLCWLPGGDELYRVAIRQYTSTDVEPEAAHQAGLDALAALDEEYAAIGQRVFGTADVPTVLRRLVEDPDLRCRTEDEVIGAAVEAMRRAEAAAPRWFGRLPSVPCRIEAQTPAEAAGGVFAFYNPPAADGTRPGSYRVRTTDPSSITRTEMEATAFHETVPGHHLQIALAQELDVPRFRREAEHAAYVEGWGLYTERLAEEMGLYSSDVARLGMLSLDSMRSARLVVDTGLHALGWSRDRALETMDNTTPLSRQILTGETDRYIVIAGQALAYKIGQQRIVAARRRAEAALGGGFDIRGFHDAVLGEGAVTLGVLDEIVDAWIAERSAA